MAPHWLGTVPAALKRAQGPIAWIAATHLLGVAAGAAMVHTGNAPALRYRDGIVGTAAASDTVVALNRGLPLRAAFLDFIGNLGLGAVPSTVMGLAVALPFPMAAYRGWIGGVVSVDGEHRSRLRSGGQRWYYLGVVFLQLLPYSLAGGTGVRLGLAFLRPKGAFGYPDSAKWMGLPADGVRDVLRIYAMVVPLFLVASLVEFLAW
ncbi:MAG TPA: hypothetical protein VF554_08870 [Thermoanaerobaculia bacterium]